MQLLTSALTLAVTPLVAGFTSPGSGSGSLTVRPNPTPRIARTVTSRPIQPIAMVMIKTPVGEKNCVKYYNPVVVNDDSFVIEVKA